MDQRTYVMKPMLPRLILAGSLVAIMAFGGVRAFAADEPKETGPFARGFGYLGAFFVTQSRTELGLFSNDLPLGVRLDLEEDLGLRDSFAVPRMTVGWRFGQRHILSGSYYDLSRDAVRRVERTIELPRGVEIPVTAEVEVKFTTRVAKLQYTYLFHRDEKVTLGIGAGFYVGRLGFDISVTDSLGPDPAPPEFDEVVTAPLPVFGFRLTYKITKRLGILASSDWFALSYSDKYRGILSDTQIYAAHRTFKHVGFAGGLNIQAFNVEFDDDELLWQLDSGLVGFLGAVTFYF
jgi:hypothetical protein